MADVQTDSQAFTITIKAHADLLISNFSAPTFGWQGESFTVTYDVTNNGGEDTCYGKIMDGATELDRWDDTILGAGVRNCSHTLTINTLGVKNLVLSVGYTN